MENALLPVALRNYLVSNKIPLAFIDFDASLIKEGTDYQILVLRKPH